MKVRKAVLLLFFAVLMSCQIVWAASKGTILYVPMDNRPVCLDYTVDTMTAAGWDVKTPPRDIIAGADKNGDPENMFAWLEANIPDSIAVVASSDALLYGGLVASRTHHLPLETLEQRAQKIVDLKNTYGDKMIYIFTTIMRSPKMSSAPVEPEYYQQWGSKIFRLGALEDKLELKEISRKEIRELADLRNEIPEAVLNDMYTRRLNNIKATELLLHGVESGDFDYLLIGRDDTAEFSQAHREARKLDILVSELPKERIRFFAGADQLGMLLLSRASARLQYTLPFVNAVYAHGVGKDTVPSYEDDTVEMSTKQHIYAVGAIPVNSSKNADLTLVLNTPVDGKTLEASSPANNYQQDYAVKELALSIEQLLADNKKVAVADIKYGNGADNALVKALFDNNLAYKIQSYSGWNTAGNSLGYALAQGLLYDMYKEGSKNKLLDVRYLDDWAYQANVRMKVYQELIWPNYWPNSGLDAYQLEQTEDVITQEMNTTAEALMGDRVQNYKFSLPWKRMFEIYVAEK